MDDLPIPVFNPFNFKERHQPGVFHDGFSIRIIEKDSFLAKTYCGRQERQRSVIALLDAIHRNIVAAKIDPLGYTLDVQLRRISGDKVQDISKSVPLRLGKNVDLGGVR
ncbi:MAG: hypothetical protein WDN01_19185 [Rhizomicrobium sp.]